MPSPGALNKQVLYTGPASKLLSSSLASSPAGLRQSEKLAVRGFQVAFIEDDSDFERESPRHSPRAYLRYLRSNYHQHCS